MTETLSPPNVGVAARAVDASKIYGSGEAEVRALERHQRRRSRPRGSTAIMGPSGSGQVDAAALPGRTRPPHLRARSSSATTRSATPARSELTLIRRDKLGFVFQSYNLIPTLNALENITLPMSLAGTKPDPAWLDTVVHDRAAQRPPHAPAVRALGWSAAARRGRRARCSAGPRSSSPTSPPATSTPAPAPRSSRSCARRSTTSARPS